MSVVKAAGRPALQLAREFRTAHQMRPRAHRPRMLMIPWDHGNGDSSDLRAIALVPHLRRLGWSVGLVHPSLGLNARRRLVARCTPDLLFFQKTRHPLNDPTLYTGVPSVIDMDDADMLDPAGGRECMRRLAGASALIAGSHELAKLFPPRPCEVVWTGTYLRPITPESRSTDVGRPPMIAWAQTTPSAYPRELAFIRAVFVRLAALRPEVRFAVFGARDRSEVADFHAELGERFESHPPSPYDVFATALQSCAVGLAPLCLENAFSRGKSFGKVLAFLAAGCAVVATAALEYQHFFRHG